jgi:hypothetical protein
MHIKDSTQYTISAIRAAHPNMSIPDGADLTDIGYYLIEVIEPPTVTAVQRLTKGEPEEYSPGHWRETWIVTDIPLSEVKATKQAELAAIRYQHETAGITISGMTIETDRESQALITGAYCTSLLNPSVLIDWKGGNGWTQIDAATIAGIAGAVSTHVQACFSNERTLSEAIEAAETVEAVQAIDLTIGWP